MLKLFKKNPARALCAALLLSAALTACSDSKSTANRSRPMVVSSSMKAQGRYPSPSAEAANPIAAPIQAPAAEALPAPEALPTPPPAAAAPAMAPAAAAMSTGAGMAAATATAYKVEITLDKEAILSQEFFYGSDLQYSSAYDKDMDLYNQSMAIGHIPAHFRIAGNELQLVSDNKINFPSDVNHPEKLLSRFTILSQDEKTITVAGANSSAYLSRLFASAGGSANAVTGLLAPRDLWIRSFSFAAEDNIILQETSIMLADGTIGEFMESIMPRSALALKEGSTFETIQMDPNDPVGGEDGVVARYRFLPGDTVRKGEEELAFATKFDITEGKTIDWYVTPNIPDEDIAPVRQAIEGWNRYFLKFKGIERKVVRFMGKLPQGVRLGDPRYNVIAWDNRMVAGAAYESQAFDATTGKQSHSLIYMPAAWLRIGTDYWKEGRTSDPLASAGTNRTIIGKKIACGRDLREAAGMLASGRVERDAVQTFGVQLLKQTLFHEVGHALGLAHNFKGSLVFDRSKAGSPTTASIMDYNDFEAERYAFHGADTEEGPQLEYDRQALSALYNSARDVADSDPEMPACNDAEADNEKGGVDPLCIRYDIESDPTLSVETAWKRIQEDNLDRDVSLTEALKRVPELVITREKIQQIETKLDVAIFFKELSDSLRGTLRFYYLSGRTSLGTTARTNIKSLRIFAPGVLPEGYDEKAMRERAFMGVIRASEAKGAPQSVIDALITAFKLAQSTVTESPYAQTTPPDEARKTLSEALQRSLRQTVSFFEDPSKGLPKLRASILAALARRPDAPLYFGRLGTGEEQEMMDLEKSIVNHLGKAVLDREGRTPSERAAAAGALVSYRGRPGPADTMIDLARKQLAEERILASSNGTREVVEALLGILK